MMNKIITVCLFSFSFLIHIAESKAQNEGIPLAGKMYFSDKPFTNDNAGSKTSFKSNEFIYGRFELSGGTMKEAFKLKESTSLYYLECEVEVLKDGEPVGYHKYKNNHILLSKENLDKSSFNFDILPEPGKGTTLYSMTEDFRDGYGYTPLYNMVTPNYLPSGGVYRLNVRILSKTTDAYDRQQDQDKWPFIEYGFDFTFNEADIATLNKNRMASINYMLANAFRYDKLPDAFSNPATITDTKATTAKIAAILKRDLPQRTILKFVVEKYNGALWSIANNEYGIPKYRYFNPHVWVAYKMDGRCYVGYVTLRENYSGGGTYGPLEVAWTSTKDDRGIDCAKIK